MDQVSTTCGNPYLVGRESDAARPSNTGLEMSTSGFFGGKISPGRYGITRNSNSAKAGSNELEAMKMAGINTTLLNPGEENDNDPNLLDNNCTPAWLQNTMNAHPTYSYRGIPGYLRHIWGNTGLVIHLLRIRSAAVDDRRLVLERLYFRRVLLCIETAVRFRNLNLQRGGNTQKYQSHAAMIKALEDCGTEIKSIINGLQVRIDAMNAAALAAPPAPVPNHWAVMQTI